MTTIELIDLYKGESDYRTFSYKLNGVAVDLSTLTDIQVIFTTEKGDIIAKYSKLPSTGWNSNDFVIVSEVNGIFGIKLQTSVTNLWCVGVVSIEIRIKKSESGFSPDFRSIYKERIYNVLPSKISTL